MLTVEKTRLCIYLHNLRKPEISLQKTSVRYLTNRYRHEERTCKGRRRFPWHHRKGREDRSRCTGKTEAKAGTNAEAECFRFTDISGTGTNRQLRGNSQSLQEPVLAAEAKEQQIRKPAEFVPQISAEQKPIETRIELANRVTHTDEGYQPLLISVNPV